MLTRADIRTRILRLLDEAQNTQTTTTNLVNDAIAASNRRICMSRPWPFMRWHQNETFTTVAGVRHYTFRQEVGKLLWVWDNTASDFVTILPHRGWETYPVNITTTSTSGSPPAILGGYWPVGVQPSTAGICTLESTETTDTSKTINMVVLNNAGLVKNTTMTTDASNSTTPTNSSISIASIIKLSKAATADWDGILTLKGPGGAVLLYLNKDQLFAQYPTIEFVEPVAAGRVYTYAFCRQPITMENDTDIPDVPFPFSEILVYDALLDMATYNSEMSEKHVALWTKRYMDLWKELAEQQDETIVGAQPRFVRDLDGVSGHKPRFVTSS